MKAVKQCFAFVLATFMLFTIANGYAGDLKKDSPKVTSSITVVEQKEAYKVDDAEYTVGLVSKSNLGSRLGAGSEGVMLLGGIAMLFGLFKRNPVLTCLTILFVAGLFIEPTVGYALAIAPAIKIDRTGIEKGSPEDKFLDTIEPRIKLEGYDAVTKKEVDDAVKLLSEELVKFKDLDVKKLGEVLGDKGAMATLVKQGLEINELKNRGVNIDKKNWKKLIADEFTNEDKLVKLKNAQRNGAGMVDMFNGEKFEDGTGVVNKVVGTILTSAVTTDSGGNALLDLMSVDDLRGINIQDPFIENFSNVLRTSKPVYSYADYVSKDGDAGFTAENAVKSQIDLKVQVKTVGPKKVTGFSTLSNESIDDIPRMQSEAMSYILRKVLLKRQNKVLFGTGAGSDPIGVAGIAKTYNQAGLIDHQGNALTDSNGLILAAAGTGVQAPNLYDVIQACALQIYQTANFIDEEEYYPNLVILNPSDLAQLKLKKNGFNQYLFPELVFNNGAGPVKIGNLSVIGKAQIVPGKIMIGDFTRLNIINYIDYIIRLGWINDNLINNLVTMVGESRFFTVVRSLDQNAFIYDDIATITGKIAGV